jgi:hypothetical protein
MHWLIAADPEGRKARNMLTNTNDSCNNTKHHDTSSFDIDFADAIMFSVNFWRTGNSGKRYTF